MPKAKYVGTTPIMGGLVQPGEIYDVDPAPVGAAWELQDDAPAGPASTGGDHTDTGDAPAAAPDQPSQPVDPAPADPSHVDPGPVEQPAEQPQPAQATSTI
jgi:hypothetical protein